MKERLILFCMLLLCGIGVSRAQSDNAKDFDQKEEAIAQKLQQAVNEKNYKEDIVIMLNIFICGRLVS